MYIRITYKNIMEGIRKHVSNDAFTEAIMEKMTRNCTINMSGIMEVFSAMSPEAQKKYEDFLHTEGE